MHRIEVPGTELTWEINEYRGIDRKPYQHHILDPGAPGFALVVRDVDSASAAFKAAGRVDLFCGQQDHPPAQWVGRRVHAGSRRESDRSDPGNRAKRRSALRTGVI